MWAKRVTLKLKTESFKQLTRTKTLHRYVQSAEDIYQAASQVGTMLWPRVAEHGAVKPEGVREQGGGVLYYIALNVAVCLLQLHRLLSSLVRKRHRHGVCLRCESHAASAAGAADTYSSPRHSHERLQRRGSASSPRPACKLVKRCS